MPTSLVDMVVKAMHSFALPRVSKLKELCLRKFAFPEDLDAHIQALIAGCATCATCKARNHPSPDTMEHYPIPEYPFSSLAMDFTKLPLVSVGDEKFDYAFVIVDRLTGYTMAIPC